MSTSLPSAPRPPRTRGIRLATAGLAALLGLGAPALAGGTNYATVADGNWADPAVWDLGAAPGGGGGDQALVQHQLVVDSAVPPINVLSQADSGPTGALRVEAGGALTANVASIGDAAGPGQIEVLGGSLDVATECIVGNATPGLLDVSGGSLQVGSMYLGGFSGGQLGFLDVLGGEGSVTVTDLLRIHSTGFLTMQVRGDGAAGMTTVQTHDLNVDPGVVIILELGYEALVGHRWDLIEYSGTFTGHFGGIQTPAGITAVLDTSVPGVISAEVTSSIYPFEGSSCAMPFAIAAGDSVTGDYTNLINTGPVPVEGLNVTQSDVWYELTPAPVDRCLTAEFSEDLLTFVSLTLQVWDDCDGTMIASRNYVAGSGVTESVSWTALAGVTYKLRLACNSPGGGATYALSVGEDGGWSDLGGGSPGVAGVPALLGSGVLKEGATVGVDLVNGPPSSFALAWLSLSSTPFAALGGTVYATPFINQLLFPTNGVGQVSVSTTWPAGIPPGTELFIQFICQDVSVPAGLTLSNAVRGETPDGVL